jgi:hypothetical protein
MSIYLITHTDGSEELVAAYTQQGASEMVHDVAAVGEV